MEWYGVKNRETRQYKQIQAESAEDAVKQLGWSKADVLYWLQLTVTKQAMPEKVKKLLREKAELKRSVRASKRQKNATSDSADTQEEKETVMKTAAAEKKTETAKRTATAAEQKTFEWSKADDNKLPRRFMRKCGGVDYKIEHTEKGWMINSKLIGNTIVSVLEELCKRAKLDISKRRPDRFFAHVEELAEENGKESSKSEKTDEQKEAEVKAMRERLHESTAVHPTEKLHKSKKSKKKLDELPLSKDKQLGKSKDKKSSKKSK